MPLKEPLVASKALYFWVGRWPSAASFTYWQAGSQDRATMTASPRALGGRRLSQKGSAALHWMGAHSRSPQVHHPPLRPKARLQSLAKRALLASAGSALPKFLKQSYSASGSTTLDVLSLLQLDSAEAPTRRSLGLLRRNTSPPFSGPCQRLLNRGAAQGGRPSTPHAVYYTTYGTILL